MHSFKINVKIVPQEYPYALLACLQVLDGRHAIDDFFQNPGEIDNCQLSIKFDQLVCRQIFVLLMIGGHKIH